MDLQHTDPGWLDEQLKGLDRTLRQAQTPSSDPWWRKLPVQVVGLFLLAMLVITVIGFFSGIGSDPGGMGGW